MAKSKLTTEQIKNLKAIGITGVTTEEEARKKMIDYLAKNDVDGVEEESFDELFDMAEVIFQGSDEEMDAAVEEKKPAKKSSKKPEPEEEEEEEDDEDEDDEEEDETDDDSEEEDEEPTQEEMREALVKSGMKKKDVAALKDNKVVKLYNELSEDEDEEEEEEEEKPAKKSASKKETPASKKEEKKATSKKEDKKDAPKRATKKISPATDEEDAEKFEEFKIQLEKILKGNETNYNFIANGGLSVRIIGKNGSKVFMSYDTPKYDKGGNIVASVFLPTKDENVFTELFGDDVEVKSAWNGALYAANLTFKDVISGFKGNKEIVESLVSQIVKKDEKLGKNREKMENDLKADKKAKVESMKSPKKEEAPAKKSKKK